MYKNNITKKIVQDFDFVVSQLLKHRLYLDGNKLIVRDCEGNQEEITWSGKTGKNYMFDTSMEAKDMLVKILDSTQFLIELYDKSIFQFECIIDNEEIQKIRMAFLKKDGKIWAVEELDFIESQEVVVDEWFEKDYGMPIIIRIDYDPSEYKDIVHSKTHMTLFNVTNCRIPMKKYFMFSEFVSFVLNTFYGVCIDKSPVTYNENETISENEKRVCHLDWE